MCIANRILWGLGSGFVIVAAVTLGGSEDGRTYGLGVAGLSFWLYASVDSLCYAIRKGGD